MRKLLIHSIFGVMVCCHTPSSALIAQDSQLPAAGTILDKYVEVTGGMAAYEKVVSRVTKSTIEVRAQRMVFDLTSIEAKPNKSYTLTESAVMGRTESGTDGEVVWSNSPTTGPQILEGARRDRRLDSRIDRLAYWRDVFRKVECIGIDTVDRNPCYVVKGTPTVGDVVTMYYDRASGYLVKIEMDVEMAAGRISTKTFFADYRKVDDIFLPFQTRLVRMGQEVVTTVKSVENNAKVDEGQFLPAEIRRILAKTK